MELNKKFTLTAYVDEDDMLRINAECEGFNGFEIIGILDMKIRDIREQMTNPAKFERKLIKKDSVEEIIEKEDE